MLYSTIAQLLSVGHDADPAIGAPGRRYMTHAELRDHVDVVVDALNARGFGRHDRVAIALPGGPEAASAFLAVACGATAAPLNPEYTRPEFEACLGALDVDALLADCQALPDAAAAARSLDIPAFEVVVHDDAPAGAFTLVEDAAGEGKTGGGHGATPVDPVAADLGAIEPKMVLAEPDDIALLLHTSGTTSRPKLVPLTHTNLCTSAFNVGVTLSLGPEDRCLNVMPLFHQHGLVAALLATIGTGGSLFCAPGFDAPEFFRMLEEADPTWLTAVPTMYQAILERAARHPEARRGGRLRFLRSTSAALPPSLLQKVEATFGVPLIEAYTMTEAAHQVTSNPLPPRPRKPGTVGVAAGPEVAVIGGDGELLGVGEVGEVVVRGANVTAGYEGDNAPNEEAFFGDWFRTGDEGFFDEVGYLTLTGRLKEIIHRGG